MWAIMETELSLFQTWSQWLISSGFPPFPPWKWWVLVWRFSKSTCLKMFLHGFLHSWQNQQIWEHYNFPMLISCMPRWVDARRFWGRFAFWNRLEQTVLCCGEQPQRKLVRGRPATSEAFLQVNYQIEVNLCHLNHDTANRSLVCEAAADYYWWANVFEFYSSSYLKLIKTQCQWRVEGHLIPLSRCIVSSQQSSTLYTLTGWYSP